MDVVAEPYSFAWDGRLWSVVVPAELTTEQDRWTWVCAYAIAGGVESVAWQTVLKRAYPGIGWSDSGNSSTQACPYGVAVFGSDPAVGCGVSDMSSFGGSSRTHTHSQKRPASRPGPTGSGGGSGSGGGHKHGVPRPTSSASSHHVLSGGAEGSGLRPRPHAKPHTGGWMGSVPTKPKGRPVAPVA